MPPRQKKSPPEGTSEKVLESLGRLIPGFHGFFKKMEKSKTFGVRMSGIRKEIDRRFGKTR